MERKADVVGGEKKTWGQLRLVGSVGKSLGKSKQGGEAFLSKQGRGSSVGQWGIRIAGLDDRARGLARKEAKVLSP